MTLGAQEYAVASRMLTESIRTISAGGEHYRVAAVPTTDGRRWSWPSPWSPRSRCSAGSAR